MLIFLVVFAHNMEPLYEDSVHVQYIYLFIYLFHMPLFVLCTGYFSKFQMERIKNKIVYPYFVFQTAYLLFEHFYYKQSTYPMTMFSPYWILWYLYSFLIWMMLIPFVSGAYKRRKYTALLLAVTLIVGIGVGLDNQVSIEFSLSRTIVYWPYFLLGHAFRQYKDWDLLRKQYSKRMKASVIVLFFIAVGIFYSIKEKLTPWTVYGAYPYEASGGSWQIRYMLYVLAFLLIFCIAVWMPKRRMLFSYLGQNSMQIFLLHGFVIEILRKTNIYQYLRSETLQWAFLLASTVVIVIFLGSNPVKKIATPFMILPARGKRKKSEKTKKKE